MSRYELTVTVEYVYEVEADSREEAEKQGFEYEEYPYSGVVEAIQVAELEDDEEGEEDNE